MRLSLTLLALALGVSGTAQAADLMRVYDLALENDATYRASQYARDAAVQTRPLARAALLPQVNGAYNYGESTESGTESFQGQPEVPVDRDSSSTTLSVTLNQSIFNWESIQRLRQSGEQVALAETTFRAAGQDLILRVAQAYFGVLSAADALRSSEAENKAVERQLEQSKRRFEVGLSAITDVQEAQARYDLTIANVLQAQQALDMAQEALAEITARPLDNINALQDDFPLPSPNPPDINVWVGSARDQNLDLLISQYNRDIAGRDVGIARARHLPTVGASASYSDNDSDGSRFSGQSESESFGVQVNVPIFAGGATQAGVRQAVATRSQRESEYEGTRRFVERTTRDAYQAVVTGAARVRAFKQAVLSNATALEASETGLEVGTRTAVDVLNAQQLLYLAERNYFQSRYDYLIAVLRLKAAAGKLTVQDLAEIDRLLVQS
ncbi:MAG TPA: TolC family outer membrane protein [Solimonas sp.]